MEQHGINPKQQVIAIVPARYKSVRLEGKLLLPLAGKPLILHTLAQVSKAKTISAIVIATDSNEIFDVVSNAGFKAIMTSADHQSGTDRVAEASASYPDEAIIINVQADEPLIAPEIIDAAAAVMIDDDSLEMATCCETFSNLDDIPDPNVVKVVTEDDGFALYFSRSPVPYPRNLEIEYGSLENAFLENPDSQLGFRKHIGLYVYRHSFLKRFAEAPVSKAESIEMLEQLRALGMGCRIMVVEVEGATHGVDTIADYERVKSVLEGETL